MEYQRKHKRAAYEANIRISWGDTEQDGRSVDISLGGIFIKTEPPPPFGMKVILHIALPGIIETCAIPSTIRWTKDGQGVGLQFDQMRAIETWALNKLMRTLKASDD